MKNTITKLFMFVIAISSISFAGCVKDVDVFQPVAAPVVVNKMKMEVLWSKGVGSGIGKIDAQLSPVFDDNKVYAASRDGDVYAVNKETGSTVWDIDLDDEDENDDRRSARLSGGLAIDGENLFVTSENGYVYCISTIDGSLKWKYYLGIEINSPVGIGYDRVFVLSINGTLVALETETGKEIWKTGNDNLILSLRGDSTPLAIGRDIVLHGTVDGKINIVSQETGVLYNQLVLGVATGATKLDRLNDVISSPLLISNEIYSIAFKGNLQGLLLPKLDKLWDLNYSSYRDMAYDSTDVAITDKNSHIYTIMRMDGSQRWVNTALTYRSVTSPAFLDKYVIVGDYEGYLYFLDNATGEFCGMFELDSSGLYVNIAVDNDVAYILSRDGNLYAVKVATEE